MEKIKDFLHDYSDVFLALLIAGAMVMVVFLNLTTIFDESRTATAQPVSTVIVDASDPESDDLPIRVEIVPDPTEGEEIAPEELRHEPDPEPEEVQPTPVVPAGSSVTVTIPNGTPGSGIARILVDHQLLNEPASFIEAAESLNLSLKLKSGTFQIPAGTSPEEMVRIIAGQ